MKNKRFKRETAWLVVGTLMVSTMLAGCSKKNVDYNIDGSSYQGQGNQMLSIPFCSDAGSISVDIFIAE